MSLCADVPCWIKEIPDRLKTTEMCNEAVRIEPSSLSFAPDHFKAEEICLGVVPQKPYILGYARSLGCVKSSLK